ncbi:MAG: metallophosphoesterase [Gemmataceae bacterium]|nr:metallophosphoesterase [Gemmataceae bacterium]
MQLPARVGYPVVAVGDLHGRVEWLDRLVAKLRTRAEWPEAKLVFLGDLVDRHPDVKALVSRVLELLAERPGSTCVMGNHDLALVKAAGLDGPPVASWVRRYGTNYDHGWTFRSYLGRTPDYLPEGKWEQELAELKEAMPAGHRDFLAALPWVVEADGHVFLHNGLSPELDCPAVVQLELAHRKTWDRAAVNPRFGTDTARLFNPDYPVWLGADKRLSARPLPIPGKTQVSGHIQVDVPDASEVRIRIDTSGGVREPLTACILTGPGCEPVFVFSDR